MPTTDMSESQFKAGALGYFRPIEATGQPLAITDHAQPTIEVRPRRAMDVSSLDALKGTAL